MKKSILCLMCVILITIFVAGNVFAAERFVVSVIVPEQLIMLQVKSSHGEYENNLKEGLREITRTYYIVSIVPITAHVGFGSATTSLIIFVTEKK